MFEGAAKGDRAMVNEGMNEHLKCLKDMYDIMSTMWHETNPKNYLNYRTFIMGIQGNDDIFPGGVLYKGVSEKRLAFRGETGAQDSIIPSVDNAFGLDYPRNSLTEYLFQMRQYRPYNHQKHVDENRQRYIDTGLKKFGMSDSYTAFLMMCNIHASFRFRHQHWVMVKKYIIDNTKYPRATGGTPITTWLPNQIGACLEQCQNLMKVIKVEELNGTDQLEYKRIEDEVNSEIDRLFKEVSGLQKDFKG
jgi:indoleamine 2,3-dioxygenase